VGLGFMIHSSHIFTAVFMCFIPRYWMLDVSKVHASSGSNAWDTAVHNASEEYKQRMVIYVFRIKSVEIHIVQIQRNCCLSLLSLQHNLCCDNCHSHVAMALNLMRYDNSTSWNMVNLCLLSLIHGKHVRWD